MKKDKSARSDEIQTFDLAEMFPDCVLPNCPQFGSVHQHILPVQETILNSIAKYHFMQGGVGGGKSVGFAVKCVKLSLDIPKNRGVVARHNLDDLYDSSWRKVNDCLEGLAEKNKIPNPTYSKKVSGVYTQILLHNGSELKAVHGKNWRRGLGADHGWFWVDDALECLEEFFIGTEVSAGLLSRLRLPHVHFDQSTWSTDREHGSLHGMVSSNPPPYGHWLHRLFGDKPGIHKIGDDTVEWTIGTSMDNPFTGTSYAKGLASIQTKLGHSPNTIKRVIYGESIPAYGGVPVFPEFDESVHIASLKYDSKLPLIRGWDFGYHHPAVVFSNLYKCEIGENHYFSLSEVTDQLAVNVWDLYKAVKQHTLQLYGRPHLLLDAGDRAGYRRSDSNKDRRGPIRILQEDFKDDAVKFRFRWLDLDNSLEYMRGLLKKKCKCGLPMIQVNPACNVLVGALQGGYKYGKSRDGKISDKPVEDRWFADTACAWRYGAENFVKWGIPYEVRDVQPLPYHRLNHRSVQEPWAWMEMSDNDMGQILTR